MKILTTILIVLLILVALLGVGLQIFFTKGLTKTLNQGVFPAVESMYGLKMNIENASVNLLKGRAELSGFTVNNLQGYEKPFLLTFDDCQLEVELMSLLRRDPVVITKAEAAGATLVIERNKEKKINVKELADALKPVKSAGKKPAPAEPAPEKAEKKAVPVHIRRIAIDMTVNYVDSGRNHDYALNLRLKGTDLFTVPEKNQPNSLLVLRGALEDDKGSFVTDLNAILEPLTRPKNPSFTASGSILDIDADFIEDVLAKNDMTSGPFSIRPSITCEKGALAGSFVDLILTDLEIYGTVIGETQLKLPVGGTLQKPTVDLPGALKSLLSGQAVDIGKALGLRALKKELGIDPGATPQQTLTGLLTNQVEEVQESPGLQELIQQIVPGAQLTNDTSTNKPIAEAVGDALIEQLENVKELEGNEAVKDALKGLFQ